MGTSALAVITPEILIWARELDGYTIEEIAHFLNVVPAKVEAWENATLSPTLRQAKLYAKKCRIPFAYFFLPNVPQKAKRIKCVDFRSYGNSGSIGFMSHELCWLLRDVQDRRDVMVQLYETTGKTIPQFTFFAGKKATVTSLADSLRDFMGLTIQKQKHFRKTETAFNYFVSVLEDAGVLVFQADNINTAEMRGLSFYYDQFPIIVVNRKDEQSARIFTIFHEMTHLATRTSGLCNVMSSESKSNKSIELFCNQVAATALIPDANMKTNEHYNRLLQYGLDDSLIAAIAKDFAVSKEVIIGRLFNIGDISENDYFGTLQRYSDEYKAYLKMKKANNKGGFLPPAMNVGTQVGKLYARTILSAYNQEAISPKAASGFLLNLREQHFSKVERWCFL